MAHRIYPRETRICAAPDCDITFECRVDWPKRFCSCACSNRSVYKGNPCWNKGLTKETDPRVAQQADKIRGRINGPPSAETRKNMSIAALKRAAPSLETRAKLSQSHKGKPGTPCSKGRARKIGEANSKSMKRLWQDPEYIKMQMKAHKVCPNKAELRLARLLQEVLPNEYKFVGDGEFILARKCPDFVNIAGQKKIIELFGEHVHAAEEEKSRMDLFASHGYQTLIIWFQELSDEVTLISKILAFNEVDKCHRMC